MLEEHERVRAKIPVAYEMLMEPHTGKVEAVIDPGLNTLTWTSLNINEYIESVYEHLADLELLMDRSRDVTEFRIDAVLKEMMETTLCQLPDDKPWTVEHFLENTQVNIGNGILHIHN